MGDKVALDEVDEKTGQAELEGVSTPQKDNGPVMAADSEDTCA